ncbi:MAG: site-specific DNA-methyltransferase, partial [Reyranella sp.]|nr:site-specific DNA-methyltransferase [Reyranella sp.]
STRLRPRGTVAAANAVGGHGGSSPQGGAAVQGARACNGWTFWHVDVAGARLPIDHLRQQVRAGL